MAPLGPREFAKYHALGNAYVVVDAASGWPPLTAASIAALCAERRGLGSDGILVRTDSRRANVGLRIFNPDGSEAEKSGNGLRIFARFLADYGYAAGDQLHIETLGGLVTAQLHRDPAGAIGDITVAMGQASFASGDIPAAGPARQLVAEPVVVDGATLVCTAVNLGNPHCVVFVPELLPAQLQAWGPALERHPLFPQRTNVQLVRVASRQRLDLLIWERGAGATEASGSSSCAAVAAARRLGHVDAQVQVHMPGGRLDVHCDDQYALHMRGPATPICWGRYDGPALASAPLPEPPPPA